MSSPSALLTVNQGRIYLAVAAVLWSLSGAFTKLLREDTPLHLDQPPLAPLPMAFWRVLFAGLVLLPTLRRSDFSFRRMMLVMVLSFAAMNALFVTAMSLGSAANAIILQYTAPMWMYLACVCWLGEPADRRSSIALAIGLSGIVVIIAGGTYEEFCATAKPQGASQLLIIAIALGSGVAYAGVMICLRVLREASSRWLTVLNHLCGALVLLPIMVVAAELPSPQQLAVLFVYGTIQMALPYWLVARSLRVVSPQEAGTITLLEPLLNPLWAYLVVGEKPSPFTFAGGAFILGALAWRYWPRNQSANGAVP